jgi:predicted Fe-Mo cluster-binding NifX family protein
MILMISAQEPLLEGPTDGRFGRSPWLIKIDADTNQWETFENPGASQSGGAGVAAAQFVIDQKASVVISGDFGPNAAGAFRAANIEMRLFTQEVSTVKDAVDFFKRGSLPIFK